MRWLTKWLKKKSIKEGESKMINMYSELLCERKFKNKVSKKAYLDACKWLAINVYSKPDLTKYITVNITKEKGNVFVVKLFMSINERDVKLNYCLKCQQLHSLFYSIDKIDCSMCKMNNYRNEIHNQIKNMVDFWKGEFESE